MDNKLRGALCFSGPRGYSAYEIAVKNGFEGTVDEWLATCGVPEKFTNMMNAKINGLASGSPLVATSIDGMTDTTHVYVNTTDGNWYYYNGSEWAVGGMYQSTGIADNEVGISQLSQNIQDKLCYVQEYPRTTYLNAFLTLDTTSEHGYRKDTNNNYNYYECDVSVGEKYVISTYLPNDATIYGVLLLDSNSDIVDKQMYGTSYNFEEKYNLTIPSGAVKLIVQTHKSYPCSITTISPYDINQIKESVVDLQRKNMKFIDITDEINFISGKFMNGIRRLFDGFSDGSYSDYVEVNENDTFKVNAYAQGTMALISYYNESKELINCDGMLEDTTISTPTNITNTYELPVNCKYIVFSIVNTQPYKIEKLNYIDYENQMNEINEKIEEAEEKNNIQDITLEEQEFEVKNLQRRCSNLEKNNKFAWDNFDKSYFAFVIDDCNSFTPVCYDTFHSLGAPLGVACIVSELDEIYTDYDESNTRTIKDILNLVVADNGEILAHYSGNLADVDYSDGVHTFLTSDEDWNTRTRGVKKTLEENGFTVRGLILADNSQPNSNKGEEMCKKYFDYADRLGTSLQYNLGQRKFFIGVNTIEDMKSWIDTACQTAGFYPLCLHGNRNDEPLATIENLTEIINYIKNKGDVAEITTYSNVFDNFGTTELEKRLSTLENSI